MKDEVLRLMKDESGFISGETIAGELNISRSAVWKQVRALRNEGFKIDAYPRLGYRLISSPDRLSPVIIRNMLSTFCIGQKIYYYNKTDSTNSVASKLAAKGEGEGAVVIAEEQTSGRGRLDRKWVSPANKNILISIIFRPQIQPSKAFTITMITSLSVVKAIKKITGINALIKWPNDIYIDNKKVGGILTELNAELDRVNFIIVGIGLNVNFNPSIIPEISDIATSISRVLGRDVPRAELLKSILEEMERDYSLLKEGKVDKIRKEWNHNSLIIGKAVKIISFDIIEEGIAESVDADGCLILKTCDGKRKKILSGDVSLRLNKE